MGQFLKTAAALLIAALCISLPVVFIYGAGAVSTWAFPFMAAAADITILVCILLLLPMSLLHRTRKHAALGFYVCSMVFGLCTWMLGFLMTMDIWGFIGVFVGLFFLGVGVVPVGMLASLLHGQGIVFSELLVGIVLTFGSRGLAIWLSSKFATEEGRRQSRVIDGSLAG
jgi:hypothetical protein